MKNKDLKEKISDKIINLFLWHQIDDSHSYIDCIDLKIKGYQFQLEILYSKKPLWFQRQQLKECNKEIEKLDNKLFKCYQELENEIDIIRKLQLSM